MKRSLVLVLVMMANAAAVGGAAYAENTSCNAPAGWEDVADAAEGRVLFIGEIHGNAETPAAFERYVCAAASRGGSTLVLLEYPVTNAAAMEAAATAEDTRAALLSAMTLHWQTTDGRGSAAMLEMTARLLSRSAADEQFSVQPMANFLLKEFPTPEETMAWVMQLTPSQLQEQGEAGMAQEILRRSAGFDRTIILVGNVHASRTEIEIDGTDIKPAAMRIPDALSIKTVHEGGTSWVSLAGKDPGTQDFPASNTSGQPVDTMGFNDEGLPHFDGYLSLGPITASPPAIDIAE